MREKLMISRGESMNYVKTAYVKNVRITKTSRS